MFCDRAKCKKYDQQSTMEATLERLEGSFMEAAKPSSPDRLFHIASPGVQETPSQALGRKLANAGLNSVPSGVRSV